MVEEIKGFREIDIRVNDVPHAVNYGGLLSISVNFRPVFGNK